LFVERGGRREKEGRKLTLSVKIYQQTQRTKLVDRQGKKKKEGVNMKKCWVNHSENFSGREKR